MIDIYPRYHERFAPKPLPLVLIWSIHLVLVFHRILWYVKMSRGGTVWSRWVVQLSCIDVVTPDSETIVVASVVEYIVVLIDALVCCVCYYYSFLGVVGRFGSRLNHRCIGGNSSHRKRFVVPNGTKNPDCFNLCCCRRRCCSLTDETLGVFKMPLE